MLDVEGKKCLVRSQSGLRMVEQLLPESPLYLNEPEWISDKDCLACMECSSRFDIFNRKHHCRRCGRCLCQSCTSRRLGLPRMCFVDPVRQCDACTRVSVGEVDFFTKQLKLLTRGATLWCTVRDPAGVEDADQVVGGRSSLLIDEEQEQDESVAVTNLLGALCRLTPNHRYIVIESPRSAETTTVPLKDIRICRIVSSQSMADSPVGEGGMGATVPTGITLTYRTMGRHQPQSHTVELSSEHPCIGDRRQAILWIMGLHKAMKLVFENSNQFEYL